MKDIYMTYRNSLNSATAHAETALCHIGALKQPQPEDDMDRDFVATEAINELNQAIEYLAEVKKCIAERFKM